MGYSIVSPDCNVREYCVNRRPEDLFRPEYFRREDERPDALFYAEPRLVVHIDDHAIRAIGAYLSEVLPADGAILDLMSSWRSHLPECPARKKVVGLGLNRVEMKENPQLDEAVTHDLNAHPALPFRDEAFDAAILTVSVQYLTRPEQVFAEVARVLKPGTRFHVIYSNRMFPTKATAIWKALSDSDRAKLIGAYFHRSGRWGEPEARDITPRVGAYSDPVYVVSAASIDK